TSACHTARHAPCRAWTATPSPIGFRRTRAWSSRSPCPSGRDSLSGSAEWWSSNDRSHALAANRARDSAFMVNVQDDERQAVFLAQRHRRLVHDAEFRYHHLAIAQ